MVSRSFQEVRNTLTFKEKTEMGTICKAYVSALLSVCPGLSVHSVAADTADIYDVRLKWTPFDGYLRIFNGGSTGDTAGGSFLRIQWLYSTGTAFLSAASGYQSYGTDYPILSCSSYSENGKTTYIKHIRVIYSGIGGFLNTFALYNPDGNASVSIYFNWFYSTELKKRVCCFGYSGAGSCSNAGQVYTNCGVKLDILSNCVVDGSSATVTVTDQSGVQDILYYPSDTGAALLYPVYTSGHITSLQTNLGLMMWGGTYVLYALCGRGTNTPIAIEPQRSYTVNGSVYKGCGTTLYIPGAADGLGEAAPEEGDDSPSQGQKGATFTPTVSADGLLSWTNDGGLLNPSPVNIMGKDGEDGQTPQKGVDYWTDADKAEIVRDVVEKVDGDGGYELPAATFASLGGVKASDTLTVDADGTAHVNMKPIQDYIDKALGAIENGSY